MKTAFILLNILFIINSHASQESSALALDCNGKISSYAKWYGENINDLTFNQLLSGPYADISPQNGEQIPSQLKDLKAEASLILARIQRYSSLLTWTYSLNVAIWLPPILSFSHDDNVKLVSNTNIISPSLGSVEFIPEACKVSVIAKITYLETDSLELDQQVKFTLHKEAWEKLDKREKTLILASLSFSHTINSFELRNYNSSFYQSRRYFAAVMMSDQFLKMTTKEIEEMEMSLDEGF